MIFLLSNTAERAHSRYLSWCLFKGDVENPCSRATRVQWTRQGIPVCKTRHGIESPSAGAPARKQQHSGQPWEYRQESENRFL